MNAKPYRIPKEYGKYRLNTLGVRAETEKKNSVSANAQFFGKKFVAILYVRLITVAAAINPAKYAILSFTPKIKNKNALIKYESGAYIEKMFLYNACPSSICDGI